MKASDIKELVKESYSKIAKDSEGCNCNNSCCSLLTGEISKTIGYSDEESKTPGNLGLGCGNPVAFSKINEGDVVLDLGSGAGVDCFLAAKKVGSRGRIIGIDFSEEMIEKAEKNLGKTKYKNVEFRLGDIENLPVEDNSINIIISNCVINLAPDKEKVFREAHRVLKKGGKIYISDIVLLRPLSEDERNNEELLSCCIGGAILKHDYIKKIREAGFEVSILSENKFISGRVYQGIPLKSLLIEAIK